MLSAILVDDETHNLINLQMLLNKYCPQVQVVATAESVKQALEVLHTTPCDVLFLDIEMPPSNGFELLKKVPNLPCEVIFVTAFHQYAIEAFKANALDYILKPINIEELKNAVIKAEKRGQERNMGQQLSTFLQNINIQQNTSRNVVALPTFEGLTFVNTMDIMYLQSDGSYTFCYLQDGSKIYLSKNIGEFENMLPEQQFCRVHNEFIVNISYIKQYIRGRGGYLILKNEKMIDVSVRRKDDLMNRFGI